MHSDNRFVILEHMVTFIYNKIVVLINRVSKDGNYTQKSHTISARHPQVAIILCYATVMLRLSTHIINLKINLKIKLKINLKIN